MFVFFPPAIIGYCHSGGWRPPACPPGLAQLLFMLACSFIACSSACSFMFVRHSFVHHARVQLTKMMYFNELLYHTTAREAPPPARPGHVRHVQKDAMYRMATVRMAAWNVQIRPSSSRRRCTMYAAGRPPPPSSPPMPVRAQGQPCRGRHAVYRRRGRYKSVRKDDVQK